MANDNQIQGNLKEYGISTPQIYYQLNREELIDHTVKENMGEIVSSGALNIFTGEFTGRSPKDRFFVKDEETENVVWWDGEINLPFDSNKFDRLYRKVTNYLSNQEKIYVRDVKACADERYSLNIRVINEFPWSNLFVHNMFLRLQEGELQNIQPDWIIVNAPDFKANPEEDGTRQSNFAILNFSKKIALVGGTGYTGEMKKGIFSALNLILPTKHNVLSMHCSANVGEEGDTALFFGLSGTGKTTLSADVNRKLIGDDEHGWTPDGTIFNFEGGCYAKVIDLSAESEPEIYAAIKHGALLENVIVKNGVVDFEDTSITQNTRVSYPIDHIENIQQPSLAKNPKNIFFLTFDAYGVLPPIAKLNPNQAAYHFISGYTSKVAGTEEGVDEPQTTFSACFGSPFMPLHPSKYAELLSQKMEEHSSNVWLINTGLNGTGKRMSLKNTRAVINAALNGHLQEVDYEVDETFGFEVPKSCPSISSSHLSAKASWDNLDEYKAKAQELAKKFIENFKQFKDGSSQEIISGGPTISV